MITDDPKTTRKRVLRCSAELTGEKGRCANPAHYLRRSWPVCRTHLEANRFVISKTARFRPMFETDFTETHEGGGFK